MTTGTAHGFYCGACRQRTRWECIDLNTERWACCRCGRNPFSPAPWRTLAVELFGLVALAVIVWGALCLAN